jgi:hypothetical protein
MPLLETIDPKITDREPARCTQCDRVMDHYNVWIGPANSQNVICWQCLSREEKGFNAKRGFRRGARSGYIPR